MINPISVSVVTIIFIAVLDRIKRSEARDAMLKALRRENTMLVRKNMALDEQNLALVKKNEALEKQLNKMQNTQALKDEQSAHVIAKLQAEIRMKDKMLEQKWKTARSACEVVNG